MLSDRERDKVRKVALAGVVTHYGDDLDNRLSLYALKLAGYISQDAVIGRTSAGCPVAGKLNVDVGDKRCSEPVIFFNDGTVVIDHHFNSYSNTLEILRDKLGLDIPPHVIDVADTYAERRVSPLDYRSVLSLARYMDDETLWRLANDGRLLDTLDNMDLERYGLQDAACKQKSVIEKAISKIKSSVVDGVVFVDEFVPAGSQVAYELGYDMYVSYQERQDGKATFAITVRPGKRLPIEALRFGLELRRRYGSGVYINPELTMVIAGGPKNPDFVVPVSKEDLRRTIKEVSAGRKVMVSVAG